MASYRLSKRADEDFESIYLFGLLSFGLIQAGAYASTGFSINELQGRGRMYFRIIGRVRNPQTFARGTGISELQRLQRAYGPGRWRKRKGDATIELPD